ncbi:Vacuolar protein sorting-associated protein 62 [Phlyctochytrium bullatum]|nr:Vacuolar protein sorting-associated protein 62 [Phlyctochytrium bullatum]
MKTSLLVACAFLAVAASASPEPAHRAPVRPRAVATSYAQLAQTYAPLVRFHPSETFFSTSVDYYLSKVYMRDGAGVRAASAPSPLTSSNLDFLQSQQGKDDSAQFLWVDGNVKANPTLPAATQFLYGSKTMDGVPIYAFVVEKEFGVVDLWYWHYSPYNLGKSTPLGRVGNHVGDWEHIIVRTVNGTAIALDFHTHGGDGVRVVPVDDKRVQWVDGHPVAYTALGSHGMWPQAGTFSYKTVGGIYKLTDELGDNGSQWHSWQNVVTITYRPNGGYSGDQAWLNYRGRWGNKGDNSCWFYGIVKECLLTDGPTGPSRNFAGPLAQVLSTPSATATTSTLTVRLDASAAAYAAANGLSQVGVHVSCSSGDKWGLAAFKGTTDRVYTVAVPSCSSGTVTQYGVALCGAGTDGNAACTKRSGFRPVRTFSAGAQVQSAAIVANDYDAWAWAY